MERASAPENGRINLRSLSPYYFQRLLIIAHQACGATKAEILDRWYLDELFIVIDEYNEIERLKHEAVNEGMDRYDGGSVSYVDVDEW